MTTAAAEPVAVERARSSLQEFCRDEFVPVPGRLNGMIRIVVGTTIVLVTSMTLEVPLIALSLFIVLFLTKVTSVVTAQNSIVVAIAGIAGVTVATFAIALTLVILRFTIDYPPLRLAAMALVFFVGMFASRVFKLGPAGFIIAIIVLVSQAYVDLFPVPELFVRGVLWVWVAVAYPAVIAIGVNLLLLPANPEPLLRREIVKRLRAVAHTLAAPRGGSEARDAGTSLASFAAQGPAPLLKLLRLGEIRDPSMASLRAARTAKIELLMQLVDSAALVAELGAEPTSEERARLSRLAAELERFADAVAAGTHAVAFLPPSVGAGDERSTLAPVIAELERVMRDLPVAERAEDDETASSGGLFAPDALTNPAYAQFALKVTAAAMLCYVFYTAVDWNGIHTCMITCAIVALGSAGATIHKSALRLVGCAIAGGLALVAIVFLIPRMTSIVSLALLIAAITAPAAWIAMGSERSAYLGVQIAFTFYLATLQGFGPSADVTEFRDRFVGVVVGVVVMALVFSYVWPEAARLNAARALAKALRRMSELAAGSGDARTQRAAAWRSLDEVDRLRWLFRFEPEAFKPPGPAWLSSLGRMQDLTRRALLALGGLSAHRAAEPSVIDADTKAARTALDVAVGSALTAVADRLDARLTPPPVDLRAPLAVLATARGSTDAARDDFALCSALVDRIDAIQRAASDEHTRWMRET